MMSTRMWHIEHDPDTGLPVRMTPAPEPSVPETRAQQDRDWWLHQHEAKARKAEAEEAFERKLDIVTVDTYTALGKAIGAITTPDGWMGLAEELESLAEAQRLSRRYEKELWDRLERVARDRRWITA